MADRFAEVWWLRGSIWLALLAGTLAVVRIQPRHQAWAWRVGAIAYLLHVLAAFQVHHHWSHRAAVAATARQTAAVIGWDSGVGIWVNYLFTVAWLGISVTWVRLPLGVRRFWEGWFLFMLLNGAVVFVQGTPRIIGLALFGAAGVGLWVQQRSLRGPHR